MWLRVPGSEPELEPVAPSVEHKSVASVESEWRDAQQVALAGSFVRKLSVRRAFRLCTARTSYTCHTGDSAGCLCVGPGVFSHLRHHLSKERVGISATP